MAAIASSPHMDFDPSPDLDPVTPKARQQNVEQQSLSSASPFQAKSALETHLADTDRRIQDASRLGTKLLEQRHQLTERLKDIELQQDNNEIGQDLKQKLVELERESLEMSRYVPDKVQSSHRKQRNQQGSRTQDIELATEISTSLLAQVRGLQSVLADKDDALKKATRDNAQLSADAEHYALRLRGLDDNEQRFKEENWTLETQVQDLTALLKDSTIKEDKLTQSLNAVKAERSQAEREYEELRQSHAKLTDDHSTLRRQHDLDLSSLRRDLNESQAERDHYQQKIDQVTSQNHELAQAVAYRVKTENQSPERDGLAARDEKSPTQGMSDHSPPPSPSKVATPRHGALESETLKSSLNHAHRMIQNLKNNIHREKTEKLELKRMLQDARDDLESRKTNGTTTTDAAAKKQKRALQQDVFKRPNRPDRLGGAKGTNEEIINDPAWEEYDTSPTRARVPRKDAHILTSDTSDAFETADERNSTATDTEAFETGAESMAGDSEGDLTETEGGQTSNPALFSQKARNRMSYQSTASDDGDDFDLRTPPQHHTRERMRDNRSLRSLSETPGPNDSPASFMSNLSQPGARQSLANELEDLDNSSIAESTPSRDIASPVSPQSVSRLETVVGSAPKAQANMVDSSMMTEQIGAPSKSSMPIEVPAPTAAPSMGSLVRQLFGTTSTPEKNTVANQSSESSNLLPSAMESDSDLQNAPAIDKVLTPAARLPLQFSAIRSVSIEPVKSSLLSPQQVKSASIEPVTSENLTSFTSRQSQSPVTFTDKTSLAPSTHSFLESVKETNIPQNVRTARLVPATAEHGPLTSSPTFSQYSDSADSNPFGRVSISGRDVKDLRPNSKKTDSVSSFDPFKQDSSVLTNTSDELVLADGRKPSLHISKVEDEDGGFREPTLQLESQDLDGPRTPSRSLMLNPRQHFLPALAVITGTSNQRMTEHGTQTMATSDQIDPVTKVARSPRSPTSPFSTASPRTPNSGRAMSLGSSVDPSLLKTFKRPSSSGSGRRAGSPPPPPLPADHKQVIAAAASRTSSLVGNMPPPMMSASAIKADMRRPRTPSGNFQSPLKPTNVTPRVRGTSIAGRSDMTRRSSVSSFASELDDRFNIDSDQGNGQMHEGFDMPTTDPRMIQAITQTMIGEFLWKYTRKAGRGEHSENRHKRFFWIHPYTRTLYWSNSDPATAGRSELKAKSVAIQAVRVVSDENPMPPGLHQKSIVVVTPGRSIKFTAQTSQRHETWFNALSYLLLRNGPEPSIDREDSQNYTNTSEWAYDNTSYDRAPSLTSVTSNDYSDFNLNPTLNPYHSSSRMSHRSASSIGTNRASLYASGPHQSSSSRSRTTVPSLAVRQSLAASKSSPSARATSRTSNISNGRLNSLRSTDEHYDSPSRTVSEFKVPDRPLSLSTHNKPGRLSSITSKLSFANMKRGRQADVENQDEQGHGHGHGHHHHHHGNDGTMENVRACCDGKHDVGSLEHNGNRRSRLSISSRTSQGRR